MLNKNIILGLNLLALSLPINSVGYQHSIEPTFNIKLESKAKKKKFKNFDTFFKEFDKKRKIKEEEERKKKEELRLKELHRKQDNESKTVKKVTCYITYFTNSYTKQEGGIRDKKGIPLINHDEPICALPREIPYGYKLMLDKPVLGHKIYKNVDTGGRIIFLDEEKTKMKVDIFIPNVTEKWLYHNTKKQVIEGYIIK